MVHSFSAMKRVEGADEDDVVLLQVAVLGAFLGGVDVGGGLVVACSAREVAVVCGLHLHVYHLVLVPQIHIHDVF